MITTPMDAEFLQHSFDPDVAGRCLLVIGVVKGECLIEGKQMLGAVAPGERLRDRLGTGVATVMAQARQRLGVAFAGKDRANDAQASRSGHAWCKLVELKMQSGQLLIHLLDY